MRNFIIITLSIILFACESDSTGQHKTHTGEIMTPKLFTIRLNMKPDEYLAINGLDSQENVNRQPAGMNFYKERWPSDKRGNVYFEHNNFSFTIGNVLSVTGVENLDFLDRGLYEFSVNAGGASKSIDFHDAIRLRFLKFLEGLKDKGWESYIYFHYPRLTPEDAIRYMLNENHLHTIPLGYELTLEQWMLLDDGSEWRLHIGGVFLDISFSRDSKLMNSNEYGSYLFSYKIYGVESMGSDYMDSNDRPLWKELWIEKEKELKKTRYAKEAELIKKGYTIDTAYQDPAIHPSDPVDP